ncbi:hypothetical protein QMK50_23920 [Pseudomonas sp. P5_152]|uniref:hypothetical protein n=1 Tax=Pseudomonas sp. P5_152 TaxID=3043442 RepID=UPI002A367A95|nr:hypothetical protein [Pseudomonas sp. P5_152]MDX9668001.1 hypothetical protein [Pseudomonas sp. P5_152]
MKLPSSHSIYLASIICIAELLSISNAEAMIDLLPKEIEISNTPVTARIINNSERAEYVTISLFRLTNPGAPLQDEKLEPVSLMPSPALYAFPFQISLAPGQSKNITLKPVHSVQKETVYRLEVKPILRIKNTGLEKAAGIIVNLSFSGLVRQLPVKKNDGIEIMCTATGATLTASGTLRHRVEDLIIDGNLIPPFNVYPNFPHSVPGNSVGLSKQLPCLSRPL